LSRVAPWTAAAGAGALIASLLLAGSCGYAPSPENGQQSCGPAGSDQRCVSGYHCAGDGKCWRDGTGPGGTAGTGGTATAGAGGNPGAAGSIGGNPTGGGAGAGGSGGAGGTTTGAAGSGGGTAGAGAGGAAGRGGTTGTAGTGGAAGTAGAAGRGGTTGVAGNGGAAGTAGAAGRGGTTSAAGTGGAAGTTGTGGAAGTTGSGGTGGGPVCTPGTYRCSGSLSEVCAANGSGYSLDRSCGAVGCNGANGRCNQCNPNQDQCGPSEYCDAPNCTTSGYCVTRPSSTVTTYDPQCGCDGTSYWNAQHAHWLGKPAFKYAGLGDGACRSPTRACATDSDCGANVSCVRYWNDYQCSGPTASDYGFCFAKPPNIPSNICSGRPASGDGEQGCGATCISFCEAYRAGRFTKAEGCGA